MNLFETTVASAKNAMSAVINRLDPESDRDKPLIFKLTNAKATLDRHLAEHKEGKS